jgi:hypothetical protein
MWDEILAENKGVEVPFQVHWLPSPHSINERKQKGEISVSSAVFIVKWSRVAQRLFKSGIKAAGVSYQVEQFTNAGLDSRCEHSSGWGYIESKCSGYYSGPHPPVTISATSWGALQSRALIVATHMRNAPTAEKTTSDWEVGAQRRRKSPEGHGSRAEERQQDAPRNPEE